DPDTPVAETVAAMDTLIRQGKVLYWGTSEWPADRIREAHEVARANGLQAPTMEQPQYNLLHRERVEAEYAPLFADFGMGATTWSPLASGLLTGKYNDGIPEGSRLASDDYAWLQRDVLGDEASRRLPRARAFTALAAGLGVGPAPLAIAWCLRNPRVSSVILGASGVGQLLQNLEALDVLARVDEDGWRRVAEAMA